MFLRAALVSIPALACSACGTGEPRIGYVESSLAEDGSLHLVTIWRTGQAEGGNWHGSELLYAHGQDGSYDVKSQAIAEAERDVAFEARYELAFDGDGHPLIVSEVEAKLTVYSPGDGEWKVLPKNPTLSADALAAMDQPENLGSVWTAEDGSVKVLYGQFIYTIQDDQIAAAQDIGQPCAMEELCYFSSTGSMTGQAARWDHDLGFHLWTLDCSAGAGSCAWTDVGAMAGGDLGGSSMSTHRTFFHTADGTAVLVRIVRPDGANDHTVVASTMSGETVLSSSDIFRVGGGPLANGGFAAAALGYDKQLHLAVVGAGGEVQNIDLGEIELGEEPIGVHARPTESGEEVHVVLRESNTSAAHFTVSLPGGQFTKESIDMQ